MTRSESGVELSAETPGSPGSKRHLISDPLRLSGAEMRLLLNDLDESLAARGIAANVYVVGGAALALTGDREELTPDIDVVSSSVALWEEAARIADEYGLPTGWINDRATPYVPPRPPEALARPTRPGLTIHYPPDEHLLAMKMLALRPKDKPDIERLIRRLRMEHASAEDFVHLLEAAYDGEDRLADAMGVPGADPEQTEFEARLLGEAIQRIAEAMRERNG